MNQENLEYVLNQIIDATNKNKNASDYLIKSIDSLSEKLSEINKAFQNLNNYKTNPTPSLDVRQLEYMIAGKISEFIGIIKTMKKEVHNYTSYFLYPEGAEKNVLLRLCIKATVIIAISICSLLAIRYVSSKIEENSNNRDYQLAIKYLYLNDTDADRKIIESIMNALENDSIKKIMVNDINQAKVGLK